MAEQGRYTYKLDVENAAALKSLARFATAAEKATQRYEKNINKQRRVNDNLGKKIRSLAKEHDRLGSAIRSSSKENPVNPRTYSDLQQVKKALEENRRELDKGRTSLKRYEAGFKRLTTRMGEMRANQYSAPIGPAAPMRGFRGNIGRRAAMGRALSGSGGGAGIAGAALTGGVAGIAAAATTTAIQLLEDLGRATAQYANDAAKAAAESSKLRLALAGVLGAEAPEAFEAIKKAAADFNIPIRDATRQYTRFAASAKASGVSADDIEKSFRGLISANKALGGSQEQANGIMLAATQVFGKGKVSAEELRGQIGERLPGAVALFAKSMGLTTAELDKRLEEGTVSVADFVTFAAEELGTFEKDALKISKGPEEAGQRLKNSLDNLQIAVGQLLAPIGAAFQETFALIVAAILPAINALNAFLGLTPESAVARAEEALESRRQDLIRARSGEGKIVDIGMQGASRRQSLGEAQTAYQDALATLGEARKRLGVGSGTIEKGKLLTSEDLINNRRGAGGGGGTGPDLVRIAAVNQRRIAQENARQVLALDKQRFEILKRLRTEDQRLAEANLTGTQRSALAITNTYIAQNEAINDQVRQLDRAVEKAEANLEAARRELAAASKPADVLRAEGRVGVAQERLVGASAQREQFAENTLEMRNNALNMAVASSTQGFRERAASAKIEAQALRERNRLLMEGFSPAQIERQLQINALERERLDLISGLNPKMAGYNYQLQQINETSQAAKDAVNELTAAQEANSGALQQYIASASEYVNNIQARIVDIASTIEQGIADAITGLVSGTLTATEAFHAFFKSVGEAFIKMAAQMIAKLIIINLLKKAIGLFGGGSSDISTDSFAGVDNSILDSVIGSPTELAKGGIVTRPTNALIGEGGMNEAVVPLPDGRSIPVDMGKSAAAGNVQTNITVNVDQGGNTSTQTDGDQANKLANAIDGAVKRVIMDERRVGGLLYNGRR